MKRFLIVLVSLVLLLGCINPVFAAETTVIDGLTYPRHYYTNTKFYGINSESLLQVESFKVSIHENDQDKINLFYINLYFSDGAFALWSPGYSSDEVVKLKYKNLCAEAANQGYDINDLAAIEVSVNSSESIYCTIDVEEEAGFVSKIITAISDSVDGIKESFSDFFVELEEYQSRKSMLAEVWDKLLLTLQQLWDALTQKPTIWIFDFFDSLSAESIAVWRDIFDFPIVKDLLLMVIIIALIGGIFKLFTSV